ncbi:MAG: hypothetical protein ACRYG6_13370 [Janthinobacterium lividum]
MPFPTRAALLPAAALLAATAVLAACSARQTAANQAEATCRDEAIRDTSEIPGIVADTARDRMTRACLARQPH